MKIQGNKSGSEIAVSQSQKVDISSAAKLTAKKVGQIVQLPVTKQTRDVRLLNEAKLLSKHIQHNWNLLESSELAEKIVDLEEKVALLKGTSPAIEKIKKAVENYAFQFVFPVVLELNRTPEANMPLSFARTVNHVAKQCFKTQSLAPLSQLNRVQNAEIVRFARSGI